MVDVNLSLSDVNDQSAVLRASRSRAWQTAKIAKHPHSEEVSSRISLTSESDLCANHEDENVRYPANTYFQTVLCINITPISEYGYRQALMFP